MRDDGLSGRERAELALEFVFIVEYFIERRPFSVFFS